MAAIPEGAADRDCDRRNSAEGEFALDTIGLAWRPGEARAVHGRSIWRHLKPWLECAAVPKIACDVKTALLDLARLGIEGRGFEHDVMLYAFLLDADPGGCTLEEQAQRRLDLKLGASPEQHADIVLELFELLAPIDRTRAACASSTPKSSCRWRACWRAWSAPASASTRSN